MEKRARGRPRGGGSKLQRTETVTLRLDPKLRYLTDLAARTQRRTVSSFIEWAITKVLDQVMLNEGTAAEIDLDVASALLWDPDEADRLARLGLNFPDLLTYDEQVLWKLINECEALWCIDFDHRRMLPAHERDAALNYPKLRAHWEALQQVAAGEADTSMLPRLGVPQTQVVD